MGDIKLSSCKVLPDPVPSFCLTSSCGMGGLHVYQPRKARACNLREEGGRRFNLEEGRHLASPGNGRGKRLTKQSLPFLTQIKNHKLWQPRHNPPANPNLSLSEPQFYGGLVGGDDTTQRAGDAMVTRASPRLLRQRKSAYGGSVRRLT